MLDKSQKWLRNLSSTAESCARTVVENKIKTYNNYMEVTLLCRDLVSLTNQLKSAEQSQSQRLRAPTTASK